MSNHATGAVNDLDVAAGKARNDDNGDISATVVKTLQIDQTTSQGANLGFRQSTDTFTAGSWWKIFMIDGTSGTVPYAVKDDSAVTLPTGFTKKALIGYWYHVDATTGLIPGDHRSTGFVWWKNNSVENLDTTTPARTFTDVTLTLHSDIEVALVAPGSQTTSAGEQSHIVVRPDGYTWAGTFGTMRGYGAAAEGGTVSGNQNGQVLAIPAPGKIVEYKGQGNGVRITIYTIGYFNGFFIP